MNQLKRQTRSAKEHRRVFFLRTHLLVAFGIFVVVSIVVTWLFQIVLLNHFYEQVRRAEIRRTGERISESLDSENLDEEVFSLAVGGAMGITVYRIEGRTATRIVSETGSGINPILFLSSERLSQFYTTAKEENGIYLAKVTFGGYEVKQSFFDEVVSGMDVRPEKSNDRNRLNLIYVNVCNSDDGSEYMILIHSGIAPLDSTVYTLKRQFIWIVTILILTSVALAIPLSNRILRPIRHMNETAGRLAKGDYDVNFEKDHGYRETQELARTLNFAARELSKTDQLQKELIANISHDLRTPLTMIRAYGEAMRDIPGENTPENVQIVIDETNRLSALVNDLLDVSRLQSGTHQPEMQQFDLTTAIREILLRYEAFTKKQGYSILFEGPEHSVFVYADRGMILQVIYNLINNAINYTGADKTVRVVQTVLDGTVRVEIRDTGEGIAPDQIPLIWDRYYKVDRVHRMARVGTGLGLSIVKRVLELHGAKYGVESEVGNGSVFWFELPVCQ